LREREKSQDIRIVVLHRGHVVVGRYSRDGEYIVIDDASVVRIWGTTRGLGEIAAGGPTEKTVLDACPQVRVHHLVEIMSIQCEVEKWIQELTR
jgi:hypothetical protein